MGPRVSGKVTNRAVIKAVEQTTRSRALMNIFNKIDQIPAYKASNFDWGGIFDTNPFEDAANDLVETSQTGKPPKEE